MATQGRAKPGGTRRRSTKAGGAPAAVPAVAPEPADTAALIEPAPADVSSGTAELLDDHTVEIAGGRRGPGLGRGLPGAIVGSMLAVGLVFGATGPGGVLGPGATDGGAGAGSGAGTGYSALTGDADGGDEPGGNGSKDDDGTGDATKPDDGSGDAKDGDAKDGDARDGDGDESKDEPKKDSEPDPTKKPQPDATKKPSEDHDTDPDPGDVEPIGLSLWIKNEHPALEWGSCEGLDFDYYKVVRSKDSTVSWPGGDGDALVAVVERGGYRKAWDASAPHGQKAWYRVFCVRKTEAGYKVVNASGTKAIAVPEETPPPDPISLDLGAAVNGEGKVVLTWEACNVDGFAFYKVVRSDWNEDPSYLPWTDGTDVIGVVESRDDTEWHDWAPEAGETAYYRVQCIGYHNGQKVLLGESAVVTVTTP